jgi:hypothetical protein
MSKTMVVELPSGKKLLFGGPEKGGLHEVSLKDRLATKASGQFEKALGTLGELVGVLEKTVGGLVHRPSKVEMEFGATLSADCDLPVKARPNSKSRCLGMPTARLAHKRPSFSFADRPVDLCAKTTSGCKIPSYGDSALN